MGIFGLLLLVFSFSLAVDEDFEFEKYLIKTYLERREEKSRIAKELDEVIAVRKQKELVLQRSIDVRLHPEFITTIVFPEKIATAEASFPADRFLIQGRKLMVQPKPDFIAGNIVVTLENGYTLTVYAEKSKRDIFFTYVIRPSKVLDPVEVLDSFYTKYRFFPSEPTLVLIDGVSYLIKPSPFGNVEVGGKVYEVKPLISK